LNTVETQEITLVLPIITGDPQRAYLRTLSEVENREEFQSPVDLEQLDSFPEEQRKQQEEKIEALRHQWNLAKEQENKVVPSTIILEAGSQELKFFIRKEDTPTSTSEGEVF
jgi:hypothetical protein